MARKALDMANFWLPEPETDAGAAYRMANAKISGFSHLIAGTQVPSVCNQQLQAAKSVAMTVDAYVYVRRDRDLDETMLEAAYAVENVQIGRLWLDFEENPPDRYTQGVASTYSGYYWIKDAMKAARGRGFTRLGLYTGKWWWDAYLDGATVFLTTVPLWYTNPDGVDRLNPEIWARDRFGGIWKPHWRQYAWNQTVAGMLCDLNVSPL